MDLLTPKQYFNLNLSHYNGSSEEEKAELSVVKNYNLIEDMSQWYVALQSFRISLGSNQLCYCEMGPSAWLEVGFHKKASGTADYTIGGNLLSFGVHDPENPDASVQTIKLREALLNETDAVTIKFSHDLTVPELFQEGLRHHGFRDEFIHLLDETMHARQIFALDTEIFEVQESNVTRITHDVSQGFRAVDHTDPNSYISIDNIEPEWSFVQSLIGDPVTTDEINMFTFYVEVKYQSDKDAQNARRYAGRVRGYLDENTYFLFFSDDKVFMMQLGSPILHSDPEVVMQNIRPAISTHNGREYYSFTIGLFVEKIYLEVPQDGHPPNIYEEVTEPVKWWSSYSSGLESGESLLFVQTTALHVDVTCTRAQLGSNAAVHAVGVVPKFVERSAASVESVIRLQPTSLTKYFTVQDFLGFYSISAQEHEILSKVYEIIQDPRGGFTLCVKQSAKELIPEQAGFEDVTLNFKMSHDLANFLGFVKNGNAFSFETLNGATEDNVKTYTRGFFTPGLRELDRHTGDIVYEWRNMTVSKNENDETMRMVGAPVLEKNALYRGMKITTSLSIQGELSDANQASEKILIQFIFPQQNNFSVNPTDGYSPGGVSVSIPGDVFYQADQDRRWIPMNARGIPLREFRLHAYMIKRSGEEEPVLLSENGGLWEAKLCFVKR